MCSLPGLGGKKVPSNGHGHMIKMATQKRLKKFFSRTEQAMILKLGMWHRVLKYYQIPSNDYPRLIFDQPFYTKVKFGSIYFGMGKHLNRDFSETIAVYDVKVGM